MFRAAGDLPYTSTQWPHAPEIGIGDSYWANPWPVAFPVEPHVPVPGWGFTPNLAGRAKVGVGDDASSVMQRRLIVAPLLVGAVVYLASPAKRKPLYGALGALATLIIASGLEKSGA
jgi:hypothetical protein